MRLWVRRQHLLVSACFAAFLLVFFAFSGEKRFLPPLPPTSQADSGEKHSGLLDVDNNDVAVTADSSALSDGNEELFFEGRRVVIGGIVHGKLVREPQPDDDMRVEDSVGEGGAAVLARSPEEQAEFDKVVSERSFNVLASDRISLHRKVPDNRHQNCALMDYSDEDKLPKASVVIIFTDEEWSTLLRTVWSVLDSVLSQHIQQQLLHEIVLVDDYSQKVHLGKKLEEYIVRRFPPKVKLIRLPERQGLVRARLAGSRFATGDVLIFLDSHVECEEDWLRPLLHRIRQDPGVFLAPVIDIIDDRTMEFVRSGSSAAFQVGGFTWGGQFTWIDVSSRQPGLATDPVASPTMAGGIFAVSRKTFWKLGSYDDGMDIWGGENLEMSFRVWQCGGRVEVAPCSRVGHIFRTFHPYKFRQDKDNFGINTVRMAEVWMDEYKELFYMYRPDLKGVAFGSVDARLRLKEKLGCRPFDWYLRNVYPEKYVFTSPSHAAAYGQLANLGVPGVCADTNTVLDKDEFGLRMFPCSKDASLAQLFSLSRKNELRYEDSCAQVDSVAPWGSAGNVTFGPCIGSVDQVWKMSLKGRLMNIKTGTCLDVEIKGGAGYGVASRCGLSPSQLWKFDHQLSSPEVSA